MLWCVHYLEIYDLIGNKEKDMVGVHHRHYEMTMVDRLGVNVLYVPSFTRGSL